MNNYSEQVKRPVFIIGGGFTGIGCAYELAKCGIPCTFLEASPTIGGLASIHDTGRYKIEKTYHGFLASDHALMETVRELGLSDRMIWNEIKLGYIVDGKVRSFASPLDVLLNRDLSLWDKFKLFLLSYKMAKTVHWQYLDEITAKEWILENGTPRLYKYLFEPLLQVKWGSYKEDISAGWIWGRMHSRASGREKNGQQKFGYFDGSYDVILTRMVEWAKAHGVRILTSSPCEAMELDGGRVARIRYKVEGGSVECVEDPIVISTVAPSLFLKLAQGLDKDYREKLARIKYEGVICVLVSMKQALMHVCQVPIAPGQVRFGGIVEWTNFVPPRYFGGEHLAYLFSYLAHDRPEWSKTDEEILQTYLEDLGRLFPTFDKKDVNWTVVFRNKMGSPVFEKGYLSYMPSYKTPYQGLYIGGMFNTYPVNDFNQSILMARKIAQEIRSEFETCKPLAAAAF